VQRHLPALEALDAHAGARGLAFAAAAASLAGAGADAAADTRVLLAGAGAVRKFLKLHGGPRLFLALDPQQVTDLGDHAARLRGVGDLGGAPDAVELEPHQGLALRMMPAD